MRSSTSNKPCSHPYQRLVTLEKSTRALHQA
ncbi:hypothetical protein HJ030_17345 [Vibrio parahaemolyticus]|nr:hypothetical protein [Vibrio parahaemolyticus]TMX39670.1 hypothetical protein DA098_09730 [Vibrio parahaemolyticus]TMX80524.1 hypothetical protein DA094_02245 [Vibrio parahaemolyticus]